MTKSTSPAARSDSDRRMRISFWVMLAAIVVSVGIGPTLIDALSDRLHQDEVGSLGAPSTTVADAPAATTTTTTTAPPSVPADGNAADAQAGTAPGTTAAADPVDGDVPVAPTTTAPTAAAVTAPTPLSIQLVPPLRDVIVDVGGRTIASDDDGVIQIPSADRGSAFDFVGINAQPALRDVSFGTWSDGDNDATRRLSEIDGSTTEIGLVISTRVTVSTQESVPDDAQLIFDSSAGPVSLTVGRTAWVPSTRAVRGEDGFATEDLTYTLREIVVDDVTSDVEAQAFMPTPEALWVASVDGFDVG